ncbi:HNH endonuclease [Rhodococcus wratislaviensis]|uniref:HNH endonuclease n=1 Tax=Rhodococcus wratislaviensis TaxID=44752 RepID=UPI0036565CED
MQLSDGRTAWLTLSTTSDYRRLVGGDKYDDNPESHYSWNSLVTHHSTVQPGDVFVLWNKKILLGMSIVEQIEIGEGKAKRARCIYCGRAAVVERKKKLPRYKCDNCGEEFGESPKIEMVDVKTYRSNHAQAWTSLEGLLDGRQLRTLCVSPKAQDSFRRLRWGAFQQAIHGVTTGDPFGALVAVGNQIAGGHTTAMTRVRRGQGAFRAQLLAEYGHRCALTGPCPPEALEAGHLYSYAKVGQHRNQGGLLLRRDLHRLFDTGLLAVDVAGVIHLAEELRGYPSYALLHGAPVQIPLTEAHRHWLKLHWQQHRG